MQMTCSMIMFFQLNTSPTNHKQLKYLNFYPSSNHTILSTSENPCILHGSFYHCKLIFRQNQEIRRYIYLKFLSLLQKILIIFCQRPLVAALSTESQRKFQKVLEIFGIFQKLRYGTRNSRIFRNILENIISLLIFHLEHLTRHRETHTLNIIYKDAHFDCNDNYLFLCKSQNTSEQRTLTIMCDLLKSKPICLT